MRAAIIEDDELLALAMRDALESWGFSVSLAHSLAAARETLKTAFDLVLLDVRLPDGSGVTIVEECQEQSPFPIFVAITGAAEPREAFRLAELGVRGYLAKPINLRDLRATLYEVTSSAPSVETGAKAQVGKVPYHQVVDEVRRTMVVEALAKSGGNRTGAARLLHVSRQAVQQLIQSLEVSDNLSEPG